MFARWTCPGYRAAQARARRRSDEVELHLAYNPQLTGQEAFSTYMDELHLPVMADDEPCYSQIGHFELGSQIGLWGVNHSNQWPCAE
jgi:hypothetical protein